MGDALSVTLAWSGPPIPMYWHPALTERSVERREVDGGTGPEAVKRQIVAARASLAPLAKARGSQLAIGRVTRPARGGGSWSDD